MRAFVEKLKRVRGSGVPVAYLVTTEEQRAIAACREAFGDQVVVWSSTQGLQGVAPGARDGAAVLAAIAERRDRPLVPVLLDFDEELAKPGVARRLRDEAPRLGAPGHFLVVVAPRPRVPEGLRDDVTVLSLPLPGADELAAELRALLPRGADPARIHAAVTAAAGLTRSQAVRAFRGAAAADPALGPDALSAILEHKRQLLARDRGLDIVDVREGPESVGGLETFKSWIHERALAFAPEASGYGLQAPRGVMLLGVQGCGKSLAAKAAAAVLHVPLLRLDLPRVLGAGDGAQEGLARALEAAEAIAPVTLWVDEIEKAFAGSAPGQGADSRAARLLGAFSTWLQERSAPVFVVATANDVTRLPPELLRRGRFDELFFVDLPDLAAREEILALHLAKRGRARDRLDLHAIADLCADYSGAELEQVVTGALHRAFALGRDVETQDLRRVAQDLVPLYRTYEEQIKALREWARGKARVAAREAAVVDLFRKTAT